MHIAGGIMVNSGPSSSAYLNTNFSTLDESNMATHSKAVHMPLPCGLLIRMDLNTNLREGLGFKF